MSDLEREPGSDKESDFGFDFSINIPMPLMKLFRRGGVKRELSEDEIILNQYQDLKSGQISNPPRGFEIDKHLSQIREEEAEKERMRLAVEAESVRKNERIIALEEIVTRSICEDLAKRTELETLAREIARRIPGGSQLYENNSYEPDHYYTSSGFTDDNFRGRHYSGSTTHYPAKYLKEWQVRPRGDYRWVVCSIFSEITERNWNTLNLTANGKISLGDKVLIYLRYETRDDLLFPKPYDSDNPHWYDKNPVELKSILGKKAAEIIASFEK